MRSKRSKSNKNGLTLVELLAVVAILGIVSVVAIGAYNGITTRSKQKAYESKVSQIETSAAKWARENNIDRTTSISVNKLVVEGYLTADEATENGLSTIKNPKNNENMICKMIEISYKNGEIQTKFIDSKDNCTLAEQALNDTKIKVVAYQRGVTGTAAALNPNSNNILPWTNKAVTLVVSSDTYKDEAQNKREANPIVSTSFDFSGNTIEKQVVLTDIGSGNKTSNVYTGKTYVDNTDAYYNVFNVDASVILDGNVVVSYRFKDGTTKSRTINVRIDKEEATASVIADSDWVTNTQKVIVKIDDGNGSGARRFYVGVGNTYNDPGVQKVELCDANGKNCKYEKEYSAPSVGEYNIWTEDMVGNISVNPKNKISVNNVDTSVPSCDFINSGTLGKGQWYVTPVIPTMQTSTAGISGLYFGISKGTNNPNYKNYVGYNAVGTNSAAKISSDSKGQIYTCYVKSLAGKEAKKSMNIKVDVTPPTITISPTKQETYVKSKNVTITVRDVTSGLGKDSYVEYAWSKDKQNEPTTWEKIAIPGTENVGDSGPTDEKSVTITGEGMTGEYYLWIKKGTISDAAGNTSEGKNGKSINYGPFKFDNTKPECELKINGTIGLNGWYTSNVTVSFKSATDSDSGVDSKGLGSSGVPNYKVLTAKQEKDTTSVTYTGYVKDKAGNTNTCTITFKKDATKPSCQLTAEGTNGNNNWFTSHITVRFSKASDDTSGVVKNVIDLTDSQSGSATYSSSNDNSGTTYYGYVEDAAGNYKKCNATYKIDTTKPTCSLSVSGTNGNNDWYTSDVNVSFASADDSMSTIASKGISSNGKENYITTEASQKTDTASVTYTGYVKDKAGNTNTCTATFKRDATKPSCKLQATGTTGKNGWYKSAITVSFAESDAGISGLDSKGINTTNTETGNATYNQSSDTNGTTYYGYVKDKAGNTAYCNATYKVDATKPTCSLKTSGTAGENGWYRGDVTVEFASYNDWASGISGHGLSTNGTANYTNTKLTQTSDTTGTTYTGYVKDNAGNTNTCSLDVKKDANVPSCKLETSCDTKGSGDWCRSDVKVKIKSTSPKSKASKVSYGIWDYSTHEVTRTADTGANGQKYIGYIKDEAGNTATCDVMVYKDTTAPSASLCGAEKLKWTLATGATWGKESWIIGNVNVNITDSDVSYFTVNNAGYYTSQYTLSTEGSNKVTVRLYDAAGNVRVCSERTFKIDYTAPKFTTTGTDPGCPGAEYKTWRKGTVEDYASGIDPTTTKYEIGPTKAELTYFKPHTDKVTSVGTEGFCSGGSQVHIRYEICDVAGNCNSGYDYWPK